MYFFFRCRLARSRLVSSSRCSTFWFWNKNMLVMIPKALNFYIDLLTFKFRLNTYYSVHIQVPIYMFVQCTYNMFVHNTNFTVIDIFRYYQTFSASVWLVQFIIQYIQYIILSIILSNNFYKRKKMLCVVLSYRFFYYSSHWYKLLCKSATC